MSVQLTPDEKVFRDEITDLLRKANEGIDSGEVGEEVDAWITEAGAIAYRLHMSLKERGLEPKHHEYMIKNRGYQPDNSEFYQHIHPIEDLLKYIDNEHANDDPVDKTINEKFKFSVYSKRWQRHDNYSITRTIDGWMFSHITIFGPCDKGCRPFLYESFRQDIIVFPDGLDGYFEWLWNEAKERGLEPANVQKELQILADWVSATTRSAPSGGIWEGY